MTEPVLEPRRRRLDGAAGGLAAGILAYLLWGAFPIYFTALSPTSPFEMVAWRIILAFAVCVIVITVLRRWGRIRTLLADRRATLVLGAAGVLIFVNWQVYVWGATTGHVVETALGYFINPIVVVLLGVLVLHERLRPAQWVAVGLSGVAVVVLVVGYRSVPWIALILAFTFGFYSLLKNRVGGSVDPLTGLAAETTWVLPIAGVELVWVAVAGGGITFGTLGAGHAVLLSLAGVITAVPLLLFATAASRLPLSVVGLIQYLTPILQFLYGILVVHEPMPPERWWGFALVWVALLVLIVDGLLHQQRSARGLRNRIS